MLTALSLFAAALALVLLWSARRHRSPAVELSCEQPIGDLLPTLAGLTQGTVVAGNALELLENGHFFDVLLARIETAQASVHFETFLWKPGELADRVSAALAARARAGCQVRVLLDGIGGRRMSRPTRRELRAAGCHVAFFHRWGLHTLGVISDRDHRKLVVIDGREAFVGGHCVTDHWLGDAHDAEHYADVGLQVRGPIVHGLQSCFSENWVAATGQLFGGDAVFPALQPVGTVPVYAAYAKPQGSAPAVKIMHHAAISVSRQRIRIQNPYFIPKPEAINALGEAVNRGVDVRVLMPSAGASDNPIVQHAAYRNVELLLRRGVRVFEYSHTLLHQKVMTVDGVWSAVGSSNFDDRSFDTNDEIMVGALDAALVSRLDAMFDRYAAAACELELNAWSARSRGHKLLDQACYLLKELL